MYSSLSRLLLLIISVFLGQTATAAVTSPAPTAITNYWTQLGPNGAIIARALTPAQQCPQITLNGRTTTMNTRVAASNNYPMTVCETPIPKNTQTASIEGKTLTLPNFNPKKIVIIGDTGCRMKAGDVFQACNDPNQWPFAKIAAHAASWHPDLVIHVGDFVYREAPCPAGNAGCRDSPYGQNWASWNADFFQPARSLLTAAPWIFIRGNHENCKRAGPGWFRFLDPFKYESICHKYSPIYWIPMSNINLVAIDSSAAKDTKAPVEQVKIFANEFRSIPTDLKNIWLLSHKPIWFVKRVNANNQNAEQNIINTLQAAAQSNLPDEVKLLLAGHVHIFEALNFKDGRPPQVIVGDSGTNLETPRINNSLDGLNVASATIANGISIHNFGYMTMESTAKGWFAQLRDSNGKVIANCVFKDKERFFDCKNVA